ncbi:MAG: FkbM family methyltransferase [Bacteroidetes bacterium]|nr:FkbM family methyltransferase [Bacteroidota bacterium]
MKTLSKRSLGYLIRKLTFYYENGFTLDNIRKKRRLTKNGINYNRYKLFDKQWILDSNIHTIIDIGANIGEFTLIFAELFPHAAIYAFEPLPECYNHLTAQTNHLHRIKTFNIGLGEQKFTRNIHQSSWHPASSFRTMGELHKRNYPHSAKIEEVSVKVDTLDNVLVNEKLEKNILIKLDVQGFEDEVIKGGLETIKKAKAIIVECSFQKLYEDESLFDGIYSLLQTLGFEYRGSLKQSVSKEDESYLQGDCIFISEKNE